MADEKQARHLLAEMQMRLARSPYEALELPTGSPTPEQVRAAFLRLAKVFHPHKFAQMSDDLKKMATEVFLSLRGAYDTLLRPKPTARPSGQMPALTKLPTPNTPPQPSGLNPGTQRGVTGSIPTQRPTAASGSSQQIPVQRPPTAPSTPARPPTAPSTSSSRPPTPQPMRALTPPGGVPVPQSGPRPLPQPVRAKTPPGGVPVPVNTTSNNVPPELKRVYEFFDKGHWDKARGALEIMMDTAGSEEKKKSYEALISVANAKEAIQNNEPRIAQIETNRAAGLDASLQIVKSLRDEVFGKRK